MSSAEERAPNYSHLKTFWEAKSDSNPPVTSSENSNSLDRKVKDLTPKNSTSSNNNYSSESSSTSTTIMADLAPSVLEFDQEVVGVFLADFLKAAQILGGEISQHASLVQKAFAAQQKFLRIASSSSKPSDSELSKLLSETANCIAEIQQFRESRPRSHEFFNHLSGISESIPALAWVTISPTPAPYIKEMSDAGQFYTNRVLKDFKDKPGHGEWAKLWIGTLSSLQAWVKKYHTTGLVWSGKQPFSGGAGGPPPPPPPPAFEPDFTNLHVSAADDGRAALFASLNKGEDVTSGLKRVSADQMTHKNPALRAGSTVPASGGSKLPSSAPPSKNTPVSKPPKFGLEGKKWSVEYQVGVKDLKIQNVEMNQVVYVYGCKESVLVISGKLNSIVVDSSVKTAIVFDSTVSSVEFVNCKDCQMQVMGKVPTITIDKVDGLQIFLSQESLDVEIVSSKSSALNVMVPKGTTGEYSEWPIPEQFKTVVSPKGLQTTPTETVGV